MKYALDSTQLRAATKAGKEQQIFRQLSEEHGITFSGKPQFKQPGMRITPKMAMDAFAFDAPTGPQSESMTVSNAGIPWQFLNWVDPETIPILLAPTMAAVIAGERLVGDWSKATAMFRVGQSDGEWSNYGDYSMAGSSEVDYNFPQRQNNVFQSFIQYGDREVARAAEAKIDLVSDKQGANAVTLNKGLNFNYMFGVGLLQNFGLLNDPGLPPPITPTFSWLSSSSATANTIYQDFVRLWVLLQAQSLGTVQKTTKMTLSMSPTMAGALDNVTLYNTNSVLMLIQQNFKSVRLETAPEMTTAAGELVQLCADEVDGVKTRECIFSCKMMAFRQVQAESSIRQKRASGSFGTLYRRPFLVSQLLDSGS